MKKALPSPRKGRVRHFVELPGAAGPRWFWQPSSKLRAAGWRARRLPGPTLGEALAQAEDVNRELDAWRANAQQGRRPPRPPAGTVAALIADYRASRWWEALAPATRREYGWALEAIGQWAGDQPVRAITPPAILAWHAALARRVEGRGKARRVVETPARAMAAVRVLRLLLQVGVRLGHVPTNAAAQLGLAVRRQREPVLWTPELLAHMVATADALGWRSQGTAMLINAWAGQRQADVLAFPAWQAADGALVLRQSKRGRRVALPLHLVPALVERLRAERARPGALASATHLLLHDRTGRPWHSHTFSHTFAEIREAAAKGDAKLGIAAMPECANLRWMELRHSAVTHLYQAGVDALEIATITGHAPGSVRDIINKHYLIRDRLTAEGAFRKRLEKEGEGA